MTAAKPGAHFQSYRAGHVRQCPKTHPLQLGSFGNCGGLVPPAWAPGPSTSECPAFLPRGSVVAHARRKWYAIFEPAAARGVYRVWEQVKQLVTGQSNAVHKGFSSEAAALEWISHLHGRAKEENDAVEYLRRMILGPDYRVGRPAALAPASCRPVADHSSNGSHVDTSIATEDVAAAGAAEPRPWETSPIVQAVPTVPSREYYRKWYAVRFVEGGSPGVYNTWQEAEGAISGRYAEHRSFDSHAEALVYAFGPEYAQQLLLPVPVPAAPSPQPALLQHQHLPLQQPHLDFLADAASSAAGASASGRLAAAADLHDDIAEIYHQPPLVQANFTNVWATALAAGDAAAVRPPPVNPGGAAANARQRAPELPSAAGAKSCPVGCSSGGGVGMPVPPAAAMAAPASYDTPYSGHVPVLVLPSAPAPSSPDIVASPLSSSPPSGFSPCTAGQPWSAPSRNQQQQGACATSPAINGSSCGIGSASAPSGSRGRRVIAQAQGSGSGPSDSGPDPPRLGHDGPSLRAEPSPDVFRLPEDTAATTAAADTGLGWAAAAAAQTSGRADASSSDHSHVDASVEASSHPSARAAEAVEGLQEQAAPAPATGPTKRRPGRPRKPGTVPLPDSNISTAAGAIAAGGSETPKRPRGRPPKAAATGGKKAAPKRPPGRPRKTGAAEGAAVPAGGRLPSRGRPRKAKGAEEPMDSAKRPRGRPRKNATVPIRGGWTMVESGRGRLDPNRPYIMVFHVSKPYPLQSLQAASAAASTSAESASAATSPQTPRDLPSRVSYSMVLLNGEDKAVIGTKAGEATCWHPAEAACETLAFCLRDAKKRGLTRVSVLGTGLTDVPSQRQQQAGEDAHGGLSEEGGTPGWSLLDGESLPLAVRRQQAEVIGRLTQTPAVQPMRLTEGSDRDALLSLAARASELQKTVARLLKEWRPRKKLLGTFRLCLDAEEELQRLRNMNRGGVDGPATAVDGLAGEASNGGEDVTEGFLKRLFVETSCTGETLEERLRRSFAAKVLVQVLLTGMGRAG
ncbi:hypothetical protein PLESTF_001420100 [Pleodorina starrii]|nr:hypothetical protein PLESTM_000544400 [Pleodorina starrii]GLC73777.1 hypothetical protein PLESTF_001420100 [Pleodorina starrii]